MSKYIKKETKGQIIFVIVLMIAIAIGLIWSVLEGMPEYKWEPTVSYPMTNVNISWEQSYHYGAWGESDART